MEPLSLQLDGLIRLLELCKICAPSLSELLGGGNFGFLGTIASIMFSKVRDAALSLKYLQSCLDICSRC